MYEKKRIIDDNQIADIKNESMLTNIAYHFYLELDFTIL